MQIEGLPDGLEGLDINSGSSFEVVRHVGGNVSKKSLARALLLLEARDL
jgi:hypothetical protein